MCISLKMTLLSFVLFSSTYAVLNTHTQTHSSIPCNLRLQASLHCIVGAGLTNRSVTSVPSSFSLIYAMVGHKIMFSYVLLQFSVKVCIVCVVGKWGLLIWFDGAMSRRDETSLIYRAAGWPACVLSPLCPSHWKWSHWCSGALLSLWVLTT